MTNDKKRIVIGVGILAAVATMVGIYAAGNPRPTLSADGVYSFSRWGRDYSARLEPAQLAQAQRGVDLRPWVMSQVL